MASEQFLHMCLGVMDRQEFFEFATMLDYNIRDTNIWRTAIQNWIAADRDDLLEPEDISPDLLVHVINSRSKRIINHLVQDIPVKMIPKIISQTAPANYDMVQHCLGKLHRSLHDIICLLLDHEENLGYVSFILGKVGTLLTLDELHSIETKLQRLVSDH